MDSPSNSLSCSNTTSSLNDSPTFYCHLFLPLRSSNSNTHLSTLASSSVAPNNSVGDIYERLPTAWAEMSEAEKAETVGWVEVPVKTEQAVYSFSRQKQAILV
ncbi:hypothetical protein BDF19DRAFT_470214 [Syncephalis fuscata]|nr:hypothetical protein BDF19DRAFT_470214 [Syncephalis fuscata]